MNDFSKSTLRTLAQRGIRLIGLTVIPNMESDLPFATGERGYMLDDNGTGRVRDWRGVMELAAK